MSPGLIRQEVQHLILSKPGIHIFTLTHKGWTVPVPASMSCHLAGHAPWMLSVGAVWHAVPTCTCSTHVVRLRAVVGQMSPSVAFQALCGLFFALLCINALLEDNQAISQCLVSSVWL